MTEPKQILTFNLTSPESLNEISKSLLGVNILCNSIANKQFNVNQNSHANIVYDPKVIDEFKTTFHPNDRNYFYYYQYLLNQLDKSGVSYELIVEEMPELTLPPPATEVSKYSNPEFNSDEEQQVIKPQVTKKKVVKKVAKK